jgi:sulfur relay (sulfurtransferase) complex TusBCD TusD component (DsrE family)
MRGYLFLLRSFLPKALKIYMKFLLSINAAPDSPFLESALIFARTLVQKKHQITGLFFFGESVQIYNHTNTTVHAWHGFLEQSRLKALCCSAASTNNLHAGDKLVSGGNVNSPLVQIAGLGEFLELCENADKVVCFGSRPG